MNPTRNNSVAAAAAKLGLGVRTVYELCRSGKLRHRRLGPHGGKIEIDEHHIAEYRARCEITEVNAPAMLQAVAEAARKSKARRRRPGVRPDGQPFRFIH